MNVAIGWIGCYPVADFIHIRLEFRSALEIRHVYSVLLVVQSSVPIATNDRP